MFTINDKTAQPCHSFIVNFEHISHFFPAFLLLNLNKYMLAGYLLNDLNYT